MTPSRIVRWSLVLLVAGMVLAYAGRHGTTWPAIGLTIGGIGCVGLISAAFLAVGLSEDRDRAGRPPGA